MDDPRDLDHAGSWDTQCLYFLQIILRCCESVALSSRHATLVQSHCDMSRYPVKHGNMREKKTQESKCQEHLGVFFPIIFNVRVLLNRYCDLNSKHRHSVSSLDLRIYHERD